MYDKVRRIRPEYEPTPPGGGGGGNMEARIAKLESDVEHVRRDVDDIKREMVTKDYLSATLNRRALLASLAVLAAIYGALSWLAQTYLAPMLEMLTKA